jgi:hypothetical protein
MENPSHTVRLRLLGYSEGFAKLVVINIDSLVCKLQATTMNNLSNRAPESFGSESESGNLLWQYVQSMNPQDVAQLSKPSSPEVLQAMERTIVQMLGILPGQDFNVTITTNRDNLSRLLASAMINGYFLRNAEQRMAFEQSLQLAEANSTDI